MRCNHLFGAKHWRHLGRHTFVIESAYAKVCSICSCNTKYRCISCHVSLSNRCSIEQTLAGFLDSKSGVVLIVMQPSMINSSSMNQTNQVEAKCHRTRQDFPLHGEYKNLGFVHPTCAVFLLWWNCCYSAFEVLTKTAVTWFLTKSLMSGCRELPVEYIVKCPL